MEAGRPRPPRPRPGRGPQLPPAARVLPRAGAPARGSGAAPPRSTASRPPPAHTLRARGYAPASVISVVVPVHEEERTVALLFDALQAALDPLGQPWEAVFVDDGSTDGS